MLILNRKVGEALKIGDDVVVTVLSVNGKKVRFGIHAPKDVSVHRKEVFDRIKSESMAPMPEISNQASC